MKKSLRTVFASILLALALVFAFVGCSSEPNRYIVNISVVGDSIVAYYSDGTNQTLDTVEQQKVTLSELYEEFKKIYGDDLTYEQFLKEYVKGEVSSDNSRAINKCLSSSVKFFTEFYETVVQEGLFGGQQKVNRTGLYTGSGVIYKMDAEYTYMITNYHVVYSQYANAKNGSTKIANKIHCYIYGSESAPQQSGQTADGYVQYGYDAYAIPCEYAGGAVSADIAIVRAKTSDILAINPSVTTAEFADSYYVGQTAIAIGNPEGQGISASEGIVSVDNETISLNIDGTPRQYRSLRMDTAIYHGNSGGGLFNTEGKLIGITNAGDGTDQSINFAIPLQIAKGAADNILSRYDGSAPVSVKVPKLGVNVVSENSRYVYDKSTGYGKIVETITVRSVEKNSVANKLGLETGCVLKSITVGGVKQDISRAFSISDALLTARPGDALSFTYLRGASQEEQTTRAYTLTESDFVTVA